MMTSTAKIVAILSGAFFVLGIGFLSGKEPNEVSKKRTPLAAEVNSVTSTEAGIISAFRPSMIPEKVLIPIIHTSSSQPSYLINPIKGELGENLMNQIFSGNTYKKLNYLPLTPHRNALGNGIDGLYFKFNSEGDIFDLIVTDAKYNTSRLGNTAHGKQMSRTWINRHLSNTARDYLDIAADKSQMMKTSYSRVPTNAVSVPLNNRELAYVWKSGGKAFYYSRSSSVSGEVIKNTAEKIGLYLADSATEIHDYSSILLSYKPSGRNHIIEMSEIDADGNKIGVGRNILCDDIYENLDSDIQDLIHKSYKDTLLAQRRNGLPLYSEDEAEKLADSYCRRPDEFKKYLLRFERKEYFVRSGISTAFGTLIVAGTDVLLQKLTTGEINWEQTAVVSAVSAPSLLAGTLSVSPIQKAALKLGAGRSAALLGKIGGGAIGAAAASLGMYVAGYASLTEAVKSTRSAIVLTSVITIGAKAVPAIMMWSAVHFGTASTGVAISSLSGAAASNAALAWLGGGTVAAGGGGIAGGAAAISGLTNFVTGAILFGIIGYEFWQYYANFEDQQAAILHSISTTKKNLIRHSGSSGSMPSNAM